MMNENFTENVNEAAVEVVDTIDQNEMPVEEERDYSGAIGFVLGGLFTLGVTAAVKKVKEVHAKRKAKKSEAGDDKSDKNNGDTDSNDQKNSKKKS